MDTPGGFVLVIYIAMRWVDIVTMRVVCLVCGAIKLISCAYRINLAARATTALRGGGAAERLRRGRANKQQSANVRCHTSGARLWTRAGTEWHLTLSSYCYKVCRYLVFRQIQKEKHLSN